MLRFCGCGNIILHNKPCDQCNAGKRIDTSRKKTAERGYDNRWKRLSERKRIATPLCEQCERLGRVRAADHVHHIIPIKESPGLRLVWSNLMSVCKQCHEDIENGKTTEAGSGSRAEWVVFDQSATS